MRCGGCRSPMDFRYAPRELSDPDAVRARIPRLSGRPHRSAGRGREVGGPGKRSRRGGSGGRVQDKRGGMPDEASCVSPLSYLRLPSLRPVRTKSRRLLPPRRRVPPFLRSVLPSLIWDAPLFVQFGKREGRNRPRGGRTGRGEGREGGAMGKTKTKKGRASGALSQDGRRRPSWEASAAVNSRSWRGRRSACSSSSSCRS